jgi:hypothetical protein
VGLRFVVCDPDLSDLGTGGEHSTTHVTWLLLLPTLIAYRYATVHRIQYDIRKNIFSS